MSQSKRGLLMVIISGLVFGIMPGAVSYCYSQGANPAIFLILRFLAVVVLLLPSILKTGGIWTAFRRNWWKLLLISCASSVTPLLLFNAYRYLATGLVTTLHFLYPMAVALICLVFFHDRLSRLKLLCLGLCLGGMLVLLGAPQALNMTGVILALLSGVTYSLYIVGLDKLNLEGMSNTQVLFCVEGLNLLLIGGVYGVLTNSLAASITPAGWAAAIAANLLIGICGQMFFLIGVRYTGAQTASIASTLEPITSMIIGILFMAEPFSIRTVISAVMILSAVVLLSAFDEKS